MYKIIIYSLLLFIFKIDLSSEQITDSSCVDNVHNVVRGNSPTTPRYPAEITSLSGTVYDSDGRPSCYNKRPTVLLPGYAKLIEGRLRVDRDFDLVRDAYLRITVYGAEFKDPLCFNGTSEFIALPSSFCRVKLCDFITEEVCKVIEKRGVHTLDELVQKINFNKNLTLPDPPSLLGISLLDLFSGEFNFVLAVETEGQTILELKIPTNEQFVQIGVQ